MIYRKELARLAPSYNACRFVSDLVRTATWGCYPHDAELNAPHVAEEEPVSSAKDSWARSAGEWPPIRKRARVRRSLLAILMYERDVGGARASVPIRPSKRKNSLLADIEVIAAFRQQHAQDPNNERTPSEGSRHSRVSSASRSYRSGTTALRDCPVPGRRRGAHRPASLPCMHACLLCCLLLAADPSSGARGGSRPA